MRVGPPIRSILFTLFALLTLDSSAQDTLKVQKIAFSHPHGFYSAPFQLSLKSATPGAAIRYTLDGSLPTATNGTVYKSPLWIDHTTLLRAIATQPNSLPSSVETSTFIFPSEVLTQSPAGAPYGSLSSSWGNNASNYGMDRRISLPEPECCVLNGKYYFSAYTPLSGLEPWVSDGTPQGTHMITDINPGPRSSGPGGFTVFKNKVYFRANNGSIGAELWETDGTADGTKCSGDLWPGYTRQGGENAPSIPYSSYPNHLAATKNMLFFSACNSVNGDEVFAYMGQVMPSIPVKDIALSRGSYPNNIVGAKNSNYSLVYFSAATPSRGMELWKSNGTTDGTVEIKDIRQGDKSSDPQLLTLLDLTLFFTADDGISGRELWKSDGTPDGTQIVADLVTGSDSSDPQNLCSNGEALFFSATTPQSGVGLYKTQGDNFNPLRIRSFPLINGKNPSLDHFTALNNHLLFFTVNGEPWVSDGTEGGTIRVSSTAKNAREFTPCGNVVYFSAESDAAGRELWLSDGSANGTRMLTDLVPGVASSNPTYLADAGNGKLFFASAGSSLQGIYIADGTRATKLSSAAVESPQTLTPDDLQAVPSFSMAVNSKDFFEPGGIYSNSSRTGDSAEKPASLEYIPSNDPGFQIDAGVRIRGGFSRSSNNPKHALRFFFRNDYAGKLKYPFFGTAGAGEFSKIDLRTFNNYSWSLQGDPRCTCLRDQFARDLELSLDHFGSHGKYAYLYINGMFFGLYDLDERPGGDYGESYIGGKDADYDVIKVTDKPRPPANINYSIYATAGDMNAWTSLWNQLRSPDIKKLDAYMKVQGLNPDGSINPQYPNLIDADNLINYMLVIFWTADQDGPLTGWSGSVRPNNFFAIRDKTNANGGFRFFMHDAEHTLLSWAINDNRVGPWLSTINLNETTALYYSNPQHMFDLLAQNPEFKLKIADHVNQQMLQPDGPLAPANVQKIFLNRKQEIDRAIVAESARWGGSRVRWPMSRNDEWLNEVTSIAYDDPTHSGPNDGWMLRRTDIVVNQLKRAGYYPKIDAPTFSNLSQTLSISNLKPEALCYITTNGDDPRLVGGAGGPLNDGSSPSASLYDKPLTLSPGLTVKARFRSSDGVWSALTQTTLPAPFPVRVCEIMYDPPAGNDPKYDSKNYEYLRLINVSDKTINLSSLRITGGITAVIPQNTLLQAGQTLTLAHTPKAYEQRYKEKTPYSYNGALANDHDEIILIDPTGQVIQHFTYQGNWRPKAHGKGASIVPVDPKADDATLSTLAGWEPKMISP